MGGNYYYPTLFKIEKIQKVGDNKLSCENRYFIWNGINSNDIIEGGLIPCYFDVDTDQMDFSSSLKLGNSKSKIRPNNCYGKERDNIQIKFTIIKNYNMQSEFSYDEKRIINKWIDTDDEQPKKLYLYGTNEINYSVEEELIADVDGTLITDVDGTPINAYYKRKYENTLYLYGYFTNAVYKRINGDVGIELTFDSLSPFCFEDKEYNLKNNVYLTDSNGNILTDTKGYSLVSGKILCDLDIDDDLDSTYVYPTITINPKHTGHITIENESITNSVNLITPTGEYLVDSNGNYLVTPNTSKNKVTFYCRESQPIIINCQDRKITDGFYNKISYDRIGWTDESDIIWLGLINGTNSLNVSGYCDITINVQLRRKLGVLDEF